MAGSIPQSKEQEEHSGKPTIVWERWVEGWLLLEMWVPLAFMKSGDRSAVETVASKGVGAVVGGASQSLAWKLSLTGKRFPHHCHCPEHHKHHDQQDFEVHR